MTAAAPAAVASERPATPRRGGAVACERIVKRFPGGAQALRGVDVRCAEAQVLVLLGPSGCGKTTLLRIVAGLEAPSAGRVEIAGRDVTAEDPQRRGVAMVFQDYALYPDKTVAANIEFPLRMSRVGKTERRRRVADVVELLRLDDLTARRPGQLSGGQRQRVGIGRALVRDPDVLLMDEPLSNLDAQLRVEMRTELLELQRRLGTTMLYVTHDQAEALTLGHRVAVLRDGRVEQEDEPRALYRRPATRFVAEFLGAMNLLAGTAVDGGVRFDGGGSVDLPAALRRRCGERLVLGVRPEDVRPGPGDDPSLALHGRVRLTEMLGAEQLVHVDVGGTVIRVRRPADERPGHELALHARSADVHLFSADPEGGRLA